MVTYIPQHKKPTPLDKTSEKSGLFWATMNEKLEFDVLSQHSTSQ